jgi:very-short-patch-repair endonuclease
MHHCLLCGSQERLTIELVCDKCDLAKRKSPELTQQWHANFNDLKVQMRELRRWEVKHHNSGLKRAIAYVNKFSQPLGINVSPHHIFGFYIADIYLRGAHTAIEVDWYEDGVGWTPFESRDAFIRETYGVDIVRIRNADVHAQDPTFKQSVFEACLFAFASNWKAELNTLCSLAKKENLGVPRAVFRLSDMLQTNLQDSSV